MAARRPILLALFVAASGLPAALIGPCPASAQGVEVGVRDLAADDGLVGREVVVDAKIVAVSGSELVLRDAEITVVLDGREAPRYLSLLESLREGDNVRATGVVAQDASRRRTFVVRKLERRPDDVSLAKEELARLRTGGDAGKLFELAQRLDHEIARPRSAPGLKAVAADAYRAGIEILEKSAQPGDAATAVRISDLYMQKLGDRRAALTWLLETFKPGTYPPPEIEKRLVARDGINAVPYAGEWVLYEEMKRREGFVLRGERWVLAEHAEFLDAVEQQIRSPRREPVYRDALVEAARHGQVLIGMLKREVAMAIGFPDDVDRVRRTVQLQTHVYDAWRYEGRGQYIFEDDVLFKKP